MATKLSVSVTRNEATVDGVSQPHRVWLAAAAQPGDLGLHYRAVAAALLAAVQEVCDTAYERYCRSQATAGGLIAGHGTYVAGPDPATQAEYRYWSDLADAYRAASEGRPPRSIPAHRAAADVRAWEIAEIT